MKKVVRHLTKQRSRTHIPKHYGIPASARASFAALMYADLVPIMHMVMLQI